MSARVSIAEAYEPVEVDLWGTIFETVAVTRAVAKQAEEYEGKLEQVKDGDELVGLLGGLLDIRLKATNGARKKPSSLIEEKWKANKLTIPQIEHFASQLGDLERPT